MKVTLKKAAALALALTSASVALQHSFSVDVYEDLPLPEDITAAHDRLEEQVAKALAVAEAGFTIRVIIGEANEGNINGLLTRRALIDKQLSILNTVPVRETSTNLVSLQRQVEAFRSSESRPYGSKAPPLDLETASIVSPLLKRLRKEKRDVEEELQRINFATTVELPADVVKILTDLDIV